MARVKPKRQGILMDLTAMSDMAWLLLTFFILTTHFKATENITIDSPISVSQRKFPEEKTVTILMTKEGNYYFAIGDEKLRIPVLEAMGTKYKQTFSEQEKNAFKETTEFGVTMDKMKEFLALDKEARKHYVDPVGIPCISTNTELTDWVFTTINVEKELNDTDSSYVRLGIKGDVQTQYPKFKNLLDQLKERKMYRFHLITNSKSAR